MILKQSWKQWFSGTTAKLFIASVLLIAAFFSVLEYDSDHGRWLREVVGNIIMSGSVGGCVYLSLHLGFSGKRIPFRWLSLLKALALMWLASAIGGGLGLLINSVFFDFRISDPIWVFLQRMGFLGLLLSLGPVTVVHLYDLWKETLVRLTEKEVAAHRLEQLKTKAELEALRTKVNPHFLFNTLNSIASLAAIDAARTEHMIQKLSELFRYTLNAGQRDLVSLSEELAVVADYLEIEKVRLGPKLRVEISCDPVLEEMSLPGMLLQPIVENAVVHGVSRADEGGWIRVICSPQGDGCSIEVANTGRSWLGRPSDDQGFGMLSVRERLRLVYGEDFDLQIKTGAETLVLLHLPLSPPNQEDRQ